MAFKKQNIKVETRLSLNSGGELDENFLDFVLDESMKKVFIDSAVLCLPRYCNSLSTIGENYKKYIEIHKGSPNVYQHVPPTNGDTVRYTNLYEVTWYPGNYYKTPSKVDTRILISPDEYSIQWLDNLPHSAGTEYQPTLVFKNNREYKNEKQYELWAIESSTEEVHVDEMYSTSFSEAVRSEVKRYFLSQYGKPWSDPQASQLEKIKYNDSIRELRIQAEKSFSSRDLTVKATRGFI